MSESEPIERLVGLLAKLPGLGRRSARRAVLRMLMHPDQTMLPLAEALREAAEAVRPCEVCGNLDTKSGDAIIALLYSLWEEAGLTVILITHDPAIAGTAPRVLRMADGRLAGEEAPRPEPATALFGSQR